MTTPIPAALEARDLRYRIGGLEIIRGLSVAFPAGRVVGLVGPNGAGKTTLIDLLSGLTMPDEGAVLVAGRDVTRLPSYVRARRGVARSFQESPAIPHLTVFEHLQLAHEAAGRAGGRAGISPEETLARFRLQAFRDTPGAALPMALRRMVDIARAVSTRPGVLLLDEPFSGLEAEQVAWVVGEVRRLRAEGVAVVIVEHRLALLGSVADSVVALVAGALAAQGTLAEVLRRPEVQEAFLGKPSGPGTATPPGSVEGGARHG
jgi:branched-chain amino acid transport system ATP-binding protein